MRPTIQMIEPEIYATYMLALNHNISPQRILYLWADKRDYYNDNTGNGKLDQIIGSHLKEFWSKANVPKTMSDAQDVIDFIKHFDARKSWWKFW